jgi:hypothetical protein
MTEQRIQVAAAFKHLNPDQKLGEGISSGFSSIIYKGKIWKLRHQGELYTFIRGDDGTLLSYLDVIIVGINPAISKVYYPLGTYNDDATDRPTCASLKGDVPDPGVPIPQSTACGICKNNEWTTLPGGSKGKACQDHKRMAVLLLPTLKTRPALSQPLLEPVFFKVPPASLRSLKTYGEFLQHQGVHWASVITRISFVADHQFQMNFQYHKALTDAEAPLVLPMLEDAQTHNILGALPGIRVIEHEAAPDLPPPVEDTGILAAFGKPAADVVSGATGQTLAPVKRGPGRPPKPKVVEPPAEKPPAIPEHDAEPVQQTLPWDEGDSELDDRVSKLLEQKVQGMLK